LPSIQVPGQSFGTDTLARGVELLGRFGATVGDVAIAAPIAATAVAFLAIAIQDFAKDAEAQVNTLNSVIKARINVGEKVARGLTTEQAEEEIALNKKILESRRELAAEAQAAYDSFIKNFTDFFKNNPVLNALAELFGGSDLLGKEVAFVVQQFGSREEGLYQATTNAAKAVSDLEEETLALEGVAADGSLAQNDLAVATKRASDAASEAAISASTLAGALATTLAETNEFGLSALESAQRQLAELQGLDVAGAGEQAVESRLKQLENQKRAVQAQIEALRQSGVTTEAVTEQIAALEAQLATLGAQSDIVSDSLGAAQARDRETESILGQIDALKEAEQAREQAEREAEQRAKQIQDAAIRRDDSLLDAQQKYYDSLRDAQADFIQDELKAVRDANRDIRDIDTEAQRSRRDALAEGRFLELSSIEQERQDSLQDLSTQLADERQERGIAYRLQQGDIRTALNRQNRDIATAYERNMRNIVGIVNTGARGVEQAFGAMMTRLTSAASGNSFAVGGAGTGAAATVGSTTSASTASMRFLRSS